MSNRIGAFSKIILFSTMVFAYGSANADEPLKINWEDLLPPYKPEQIETSKPKTFFSGSVKNETNSADPPPPLREGKFMEKKSKRSEASSPPDVVTKFNGKQITVDGYVVPLDFDATKNLKEFLLVPFVGACIHVPPPPVNQIIYVKNVKNFKTEGTFEFVTVTGTLNSETAFTGIADAGYTLNAETVQHNTE